MSTDSDARDALRGLSVEVTTEIRAVLRELRGADPERVRDALIEVLPALCDEFSLAAAALGADYYDSVRADAGVSGVFVADPVAPVESARWEALAVWGVAGLFAATPDWDATTSRVTGGAQRTVADRHRLTVVESSQADPGASGWRRVGDGSSCGFCSMLISRNAVYREETVTFKAHDHCGCFASPAWETSGRTVSAIAYKASERSITGRDRGRVRDYLRDHGNQ